ncbi:hypothetical protein F3Y22_tig00111947pilonHSYRG00179 [Hibiscus syriacus]|uniref:Uncharacterized protein n=1 Tax=Hibiscus syriacus TaxID=106335 RepID=A0A6A2YEQ8_HIBSY|nr:uncharacterized protein LOC120173359 [Hibiscus syriacus]KAE8671514.1 hypothetical protein F3Y22_tig00111947pilonHSYRG00179 [Hibiscus syriacus]
MGLSKSECKIHPSQHQNQGVCPSCLRERLSSLCSTPLNESTRLAPYYASNSASPAPRRISHRRNGSEVMGVARSSSFMVKVGDNYGLKKSRSIAFVPRKVDDEDVQNRKKKKNKERKGFWSKLLRLKGKKMDLVMQSTSMRI